jgi:plastocyanin
LPAIVNLRPALPAILVAFVAGACAPASNIPNVPVRQVSSETLVSVVDSLYDAGRGASVALDADGNPAVSYLLYSPVLKKGEIPPGVKVGEPQPPAVILATQSQGIWTRVSVTPQKTSPAVGDAPEITNDKNQSVPGVNTALAIDGQGKHHVAWATPHGVFYANDASGAFGEKEQVTASAAVGASIGVASDGTVWISYYDRGDVVAAMRTGTGWTRESVRPQTGQANAPASVTSMRVGADGQPIVAFGEGQQTAVATRSADGAWSFEEIEGEGGFGVSLALDGDGNPFVAFYDRQGAVHQASRIGGGTWTVNQVATTAAGPNQTGDPRWSTGIGVDGQGASHVVFADTAQQAIVLATGTGSTFSPERIEGSEGGTNPALAVSPDGAKRAVAWFDGENANLNTAQTGIEGLAIAHPTSAAALPSPGASTPTEAPCQPSILEVSAQNLAFDKDCLAAPAGEPFTIVFDNMEPVPHNVDVYDQQGGAHIAGAAPTDIFTGPGTAEYDSGPLEEGIYFFQCDVHPTQMFGTFVVGSP